MEQNQKHYYAFISYSSEDEKIAKWLQRELENYHIPTTIQKECHAPKRLKPIFLFQTDLSGNKLRDALEGELSDSQFLIVICSPSAAKSNYVNGEVQHFIDSGRYDKIIPFIVKGTPFSSLKGDLEEECFPPALVSLKGTKQELRGIDLHEEQKHRGSKKAAIIDVIASMLGVRMDVLWDRYKRRIQKIRNISIACLAFLMLVALGIYDYTRTKVEFYADWVDCNGVAQGVIPLDKDQVAHRYYSFKFEYSRVPFGEKGFYSWRLDKVSIVNSQGVISSYTPDNHAYFYPIQEYIYTDSYLTEIINRDTYKRVVMRYSVKDDANHNVACIYDMEGAEKHQGSAYLSSSTTAIVSRTNSMDTKSKIKRFHYTRNEKGYITKVTYHANDADELDESAIGDNNNIYGKTFDLDSLGRVTKITYINHEGRPMTDKNGVGYIRYNNAVCNQNDTIEYLGSDGKLAYNEQKYARLVSKLDQYGNPIEQWYEGADGRPCYNHQNIYRQVITFDTKGCLTEMKYYGFDGNLSYSSDNYAIERGKYDNRGRYIEASYYDINGEPCYSTNNYSIVRVKYDVEDRMIEYSTFDINGKPCAEKTSMVHKQCYKYDEYNYLTHISLYDENGNPTVSPETHFSTQIIEYDEYHQPILFLFLDEKGNPCYDDEYASIVRYSYDKRGNLTKIECLDIDNQLRICKEGYASITYKYDNYGNQVEEKYWGTNGEPIYINGCTTVRYNHYPNGLLAERRYYDENDSLCLNSTWFAICKYEYDADGNLTRISFFDKDSMPCYYKLGLYSSLECEYDYNGNRIKETYYDIHNKKSLMSDGLFSIAKYKYDSFRRITEYAYYDENEHPCFYYKKYHKICVRYDSKGNAIQYSHYNTKDEPCKPYNESEIIRYTYNTKNYITRIDYADRHGKNVNIDTQNYSSERRKYDELNRLTEVAYFDKDNNPCWKTGNPFSYCRILHYYDLFGNLIEYDYFDPQGKLTNTSGVAKVIQTYDIYQRILTRKYYDSGGHLTPSAKYQKAIEEYEYNDFNQICKINLFQADSTFFISHTYLYNSRGQVVQTQNRDEDGKLKVVLIPAFGEVPYASLKIDWDDRGNVTRHSYYDEGDNLWNTKDGFAIKNYTYDKYGHLIMEELFDNKGLATHSIVQGWHKSKGKYNQKGLIEEISYYDETNNYVNANTENINGGGCKIVYQYDETGCRTNSILYVYRDGKLMKDKPSTTGEAIEKSLVIGNVLMQGLFMEKGYSGSFFIIALNDWNIYDDLNKFGEILVTSAECERHFIMAPWKEDEGVYHLGKIIDVTFPAGILGVRFMDLQGYSDLFNDLVDMYENYKIEQQSLIKSNETE